MAGDVLLSELDHAAGKRMTDVIPFTGSEPFGSYAWTVKTLLNLGQSGLTGGGGSNLDGVPTAQEDVGQIWNVVSSSNFLSPYQLKGADLAPVTPDVIRPLDFDETIPKSFQLLGLAVSKLAILGVGGTGCIELALQDSVPPIPASGVKLYSADGNLAWIQTDGFIRSFAASLTGHRTYYLPDVDGQFLVAPGAANVGDLFYGTTGGGVTPLSAATTNLSVLTMGGTVGSTAPIWEATAGTGPVLRQTTATVQGLGNLQWLYGTDFSESQAKLTISVNTLASPRALEIISSGNMTITATGGEVAFGSATVTGGDGIFTDSLVSGGTVQTSNGSAGAPSYTFGNDHTVGFYYDTGAIYVALAGVSAARFVGNGLASMNGADAGKYLRGDGTWQALVAPAWGAITGKPTTLGGYGITDAVASANFTWANLGGKPAIGNTDAATFKQLTLNPADGTTGLTITGGFGSGSIGMDVNADSDGIVAQFHNTSTSAGHSFGVAIIAGTNGSDFALDVYSADGSRELMMLSGLGNLSILGSLFSYNTQVTDAVGKVRSAALNTVAVAQGGSGLTAATLGDLRYGSSSTTLAALAGNTSATMAVLTQTGTGSTSAAPVWTSTIGTGNVVRATSPVLVTPVMDTITASAATNLVLNGGSSGAQLSLGQGATGIATLTSNNVLRLNPGTNQNITSTIADGLAAHVYTSTGTTLGIYNQIRNSDGSAIFDWGVGSAASAHVFIGSETDKALCFRVNNVERMRISPTSFNVLIGTTIDIAGSNGLKVAGTTTSSSTSTGSLINAGGFGNAGAAYFGGVTTITNTTQAINPDTGALVVGNGTKATSVSIGAGNLSVGGLTLLGQNSSVSATAWGLNGIVLRTGIGSYTDTSSSGTVASCVMHSIGQSTVGASSATTYTDFASLYLATPFNNGGNVTTTRQWGIWMAAGAGFRMDSANSASGALSGSGSGFYVAGGGTFMKNLYIGVSNDSNVSWTTTGIQSATGSATYTNTSTAGSGTAATAVFNSYAAPTLAATNTLVTTTDAATVYIAGGPIAGTNQTITNSWGLWNVGKTKLGDVTDVTFGTLASGGLQTAGGVSITKGLQAGGQVMANVSVDNVTPRVTGTSAAYLAGVAPTLTRDLFAFGDTSRVGLLRGFQNGGNNAYWEFGGYINGGAFVEHARLETVVNSLTSGAFKVFMTTTSTSTSTGSLINSGGLGNAGASFFGGQVNATTTIAVGTSPSLIYGNSNGVGIGQSNPQAVFDVSGTIRSGAAQNINGFLAVDTTNNGQAYFRVSDVAASVGTISVTPLQFYTGNQPVALALQSQGSYNAWGATGVKAAFGGHTYTDASTAGSGTAAIETFTSFSTPTLAATNTLVTTTDAATVYIAGAPIAGTNMTITNSWGLWNVGKTRLDGQLKLGTGLYSATGVIVFSAGGTTTADGIWFGNGTGEVIHRSATNTLTMTGSFIVNSNFTANGLASLASGIRMSTGRQFDFIYDASSFKLRDTTAGVDAYLITAGAISAGIFAHNYTTASTSTTTGSLTNAGGFGNAGAAYIGGILNLPGSDFTTTYGIKFATDLQLYRYTASSFVGLSLDYGSTNGPSFRINNTNAREVASIAFAKGGVIGWYLGSDILDTNTVIWGLYRAGNGYGISFDVNRNATLGAKLSVTKGFNTAVVAMAALDIDWSQGNDFTKTLSANTTFTFSNLTEGQTINVTVTNTASNYTVTWPTISWPAGVAPVQTVGAKSDVYTFKRVNGVTYGNAIQNF